MTHPTAVPRQFSLEECQRIVARMWPYLDGALSDGERELVVQHLAACSKCEPHFRFAQSFLHAVHMAHGVSPDFSSLRARIVAALSHEGFESPELT